MGAHPVTELSLFSGLAGFTLGLRLAGVAVRTLCYVELGRHPQEVLKARIRDGLLDDAPVWDDIRTFDGRPWRGVVDIVTAGFPCQPFSLASAKAGRGGGAGDPRNLWPDTIRVVREARPRHVLLENVPGILSPRRAGGRPLAPPYAATVLGDLAEAGYDAVWDSIPAAAAGAPHLRWRWWCLAWDPDQDGWEGLAARTPVGPGPEAQPAGGRGPAADAPGLGGHRGQDNEGEAEEGRRRAGQGRQAVADPDGLRRHRGPRLQEAPGSAGLLLAEGGRLADAGGPGRPGALQEGEENAGQEEADRPPGEPGRPGWWATEPRVGRVAYGVAHRVDRLRALGDGLVPAVVAEFLRRVTRLERDRTEKEEDLQNPNQELKT